MRIVVGDHFAGKELIASRVAVRIHFVPGNHLICESLATISDMSSSALETGAISLECFFSEEAERVAGGEMALDVEGVEDSGVNGQEALG